MDALIVAARLLLRYEDMLNRFIFNWEKKLASRDNNRSVRLFEWGLDHLDWAVSGAAMASTSAFECESARDLIFAVNDAAIENSDEFFAHGATSAFEFDGHWLSYTSPVETPYPKNNTVYARYFPVDAGLGNNDIRSQVDAAKGRAVLVLPQWNADVEGHVAICKLLNRFGIAGLRLSLPYQDRRMLPGFERADYLVSPNIGRTLQGVRQAVLDSRVAIDWLYQQGYDRIGIMGTSIGSCISFLAYVHDQRVKTGVFNHVSSYFGDVVWVGMTTAHVRKGLETDITEQDVRRVWSAISPNSYVQRLADDTRTRLMISGRYDPSFTPELSRLLFQECKKWGVRMEKRIVPCGHYTLGEFPFKYYVAYLIARSFTRNL